VTKLTFKSIYKFIQYKNGVKNTFSLDKDEKFFSYYDLKYSLSFYGKNKIIVNEKPPGLAKKLFKKFVYDWNPYFRFSSRMINVHLIAFIALYYAFLTLLFKGIVSYFSITGKVSDLFAKFMSPLQALDDSGIQFMPILIKQDYMAAFIVPVILAFLICLFQFFYGLRGIQQGLLKMYRGYFELVPYKKKKIKLFYN
jgi:hypothetical protein